jgi:DNA-binding NarL/FixJ family response regulator
MKRCLITEDQPECRRWLRSILRATFSEPQIFEAADLKASLDFAANQPVDIALIDLALPDGNGLEVVRVLQRKQPQATCVIITVIGDDAQIVAALSAGASGYLLKEQPAELLSRQLRELESGVPPLSPSVARRIMEHFQRTGPSEAFDGSLTEREKQTLALISRGLRNNETAAQLGIAPSTVASHIKSIYRKLGITNRAEASWHATRLGL